jgi:hypothetical protein
LVRKSIVRWGLRGHHPHPPAPSPASGRRGESRGCTRAICAILTWYPRARFNCFAPLAPGRGEGLGVRGKTAQRLRLRGGWGGEVVDGFDWVFGA